MPASFPSLLLPVPDLDEAWGSWGVNKSFLASDFLHLYTVSTYGDILYQSLGRCDVTSEETKDI